MPRASQAKRSKPTRLGPSDSATISPEARAFLRANRAVRVPFIPVSPTVARLARRLTTRETARSTAAVKRGLIADVTRLSHGGVEVVQITPRRLASGDDFAIHVHGGAFVLGDALDLTAMLMADALRMVVLSIQYPLAPEARHPEPLDACVAAYGSIVTDRAGRFVLTGESAGGSLALGLMQRIQELALPEPAGLGLFTPWADLTGVGDSYRSNEGRDPVIGWRHQLDKLAGAYAGTTPRSDPLMSPINATWSGPLPPTIITTGTRDLFLSDCIRLHRALRDTGAPCELRIWEGMWHAFNEQPDIPEAAHCRAEVAMFLHNALQPD